MKKIISGLAMALAVISLTSCASMSDVINSKEKGKGTTKVYPVSQQQAWEIAKTVFRWEGSDAIEEHRKEGYMLTSSGMTMFSYGTVMGAWIGKGNPKGTKVTVITKRRIKINLATTLTEKTFHKRFAQAVDIVKSGKPLPAHPPK